jgi:predicted extracellular nuclease
MRALVIALAAFLVLAPSASAAVDDLVVSQVYGGGGNGGASHSHDFVEFYNAGNTAVPLTGLSLQYASSTGTGNLGANAGQLTELSGEIQPRRYFLVQQATSDATVGAPLPTPDLADPTPINMSGTAGKVALVTGTASLGCNGGSAPCDAAALARIVDLVGYGNANFFEGAGAAPGLSAATSAQRRNGGCQDTNDNAADFEALATAPRSSATAAHFCDADEAPRAGETTPAANASDVAQDSSITITFSEDVAVSGDWFSITCSTTGAHAATVSGGPRTFTLDPAADFGMDETCTVTVRAANVSDADANDPPDQMAADHSWSFTTPAPTLRIHQIQGAGHESPYVGRRTSFVPGVVTAVRSNGFWMEDPQPDRDPDTSEGILVFTGSRPTVAIGQAVTVSGQISEFRPGGESTDNLTTTELEFATVYPGAAGDEIDPTVVGKGGRVPPDRVIEDDALTRFQPRRDGIDFYESLEGMLLQVNDAVVVGPTNGFGEVWVLGDRGREAGPRTDRGGILVTASDFNPERIQLDDVLAPTPVANIGDRIPGATVGVLSYDFGNFEMYPRTAPVAVSGGLEREVTRAPRRDELAVGTFNVENLDPSDAATIPRLARLVVENMRSPDLIGIEEMQDNTGATNDGTTDASLSWQAFIDAIVAAGGPRYDYRQIDPENNADGGQPGGNIRVGFLFRTDRGLEFVDRPGGDATTPTEIERHRDHAHLTLSPGRVDPQNPAWEATRKPLAGEFRWRGEQFFAIVNHFSSKGGDDPLFGRVQPPVRSTEVARHQQAASVNAFVDELLDVDRRARVVVLGDINDFDFSETTEILEGRELRTLFRELPKDERYSYVFEGNSQVLDQILLSDGALRDLEAFDVVHVNAEFADQASDHDPSVARLDLD